jgi:hypothetical protein
MWPKSSSGLTTPTIRTSPTVQESQKILNVPRSLMTLRSRSARAYLRIQSDPTSRNGLTSQGDPMSRRSQAARSRAWVPVSARDPAWMAHDKVHRKAESAVMMRKG